MARPVEPWHLPYMSEDDSIVVDGITVDKTITKDRYHNRINVLSWEDRGITVRLEHQPGVNYNYGTVNIVINKDRVLLASSYGGYSTNPDLTPELKKYALHWIAMIRTVVEERTAKRVAEANAAKQANEAARLERITNTGRLLGSRL